DIASDSFLLSRTQFARDVAVSDCRLGEPQAGRPRGGPTECPAGTSTPAPRPPPPPPPPPPALAGPVGRPRPRPPPAPRPTAGFLLISSLWRPSGADSVLLTVTAPSSRTPALSHFWIGRMMRRSPIRCSKKRISHSWLISSKNEARRLLDRHVE